MYHISKDKRTMSSAELIYQGLLTCLKKKPFEQIRISDLQRESTVARSTFYRSFDTISDVLYWKCDLCFQEVLEHYIQDNHFDERELAYHYFQYWMVHSEILELLMQINRYDIIYACHMKNAKKMQASYGKRLDISLTPREGSYYMSIRTGLTISVLMTWLKGGCKESAEELVEMLVRFIR